MTNRTNIPPGLTDATGAIYCKNDPAANGTTDLYYINDLTAREYQITNVVSNAAGAAAFAKLGTNTNTNAASGDGGWTWMGQGIILQYGLAPHASTETSVTITYPIPFSTIPYSIQVSAVAVNNSREDLSVRFANRTNTSFKVETTQSADLTSIYWIAVGPY